MKQCPAGQGSRCHCVNTLETMLDKEKARQMDSRCLAPASHGIVAGNNNLTLETMSDKERLDKGIAGSLTVGAGLCILLCPIEYDLVIIGSFDF